MKFTLILLLLAAFPCDTLRKNRGKNTKEHSNRLPANRLINQLSKLEGFKTCNLYIDKNVKSSKMTDLLQKQLAKMFPTTTIGKKNLQISKFKRKPFSKMINSRKREQRGLLNSASGNSIFIAVVGWVAKYPTFLSNLSNAYFTLALPSSIPKVLVISVTKKKRVYRRVFKYLTSAGIIDVEILEISRRNRKVRGYLKRDSVSLTLHKCNPFLKSLKKRALGRNVKWFEDKFRNLNGLKLRTRNEGEVYSYKVFGKKTVKAYTGGPKSLLATHFMTSMNMSFKIVGSNDDCDLILIDDPLIGDSAFYPRLKPFMLVTSQLYTPIIYDSQFCTNVDYFYFYLLMTLLTLLLLRVCCTIGRFDRRTWSSYEVLKMLFGLSNSRNPLLFIESALFCLISLCGICVANFFSETVTDSLVPVEEERVFHTFADLRDNNVTLYLQFEPGTVQMESRHENPIISSNVSYQVESDNAIRMRFLMVKMLNSKNMSIAMVEMSKFALYDSKVVSNGKVLARRSDMREYSYVTSFLILEYSPYFERLSDLYWRFEECGFSIWSKIVEMYAHYYVERDLERSVLKNQRSDEDFESLDDFTSRACLYVLFFGVTASLVALLAEIVYFRLTNRNDDLHVPVLVQFYFSLIV